MILEKNKKSKIYAKKKFSLISLMIIQLLFVTIISKIYQFINRKFISKLKNFQEFILFTS